MAAATQAQAHAHSHTQPHTATHTKPHRQTHRHTATATATQARRHNVRLELVNSGVASAPAAEATRRTAESVTTRQRQVSNQGSRPLQAHRRGDALVEQEEGEAEQLVEGVRVVLVEDAPERHVGVCHYDGTEAFVLRAASAMHHSHAVGTRTHAATHTHTHSHTHTHTHTATHKPHACGHTTTTTPLLPTSGQPALPSSW